jgi:DNA replication protein DnaC
MAPARATAKPGSRDLTAEVAFLTRALKAPTLRESVDRLAERARAESWSHEEFLVACLQREVTARESHGGEGRIRAARFPARKSLEEFDFDHARGLRRDLIAHLGTLDFVTAKDNVVFLGPPGTGKTHLAIGLAIRACQAGHRVAFATAADWVSTLAQAHHAGRLQAELTRLGRYPLLVIDLCRPRDYAEGRVWVLPVETAGWLWLGIVTGLRGMRASCRWGGSGRAWPLRGW